MLENLPVLGVCGYSGSGKTTLIEKLSARLCARGLRVVAVKHDVHGIDVDRPGKDSDRFYSTGADVLLDGPGQEMRRLHRRDRNDIVFRLAALARRYDVVLVEGRKHTPLPKLWLLGDDETAPPAGVTDILAVLPRDADRLRPAERLLDGMLADGIRNAPIFGGILIDEKKTSGSTDGTYLRWIVDTLRPLCAKIATLGGEIPGNAFPGVIRLPNCADAGMPIGGVLAAMRWAPNTSWIFASNEPPGPTIDELRRLLAARAPGRWAVLTESNERGALPAYYDFRSLETIEQAACANGCLWDIAGDPRTVTIPA